jgi:hypothetical protein
MIIGFYIVYIALRSRDLSRPIGGYGGQRFDSA